VLTHRATLLAALLLTLTGAACAPEGAGEDESAEGTESAASTNELVPMTSMPKGASKTGVYTATVAGEITFKTAGTGDVDLYIKKGATAPTTTSFDGKSDGPTSVEQVKITVAKGDQVRFLLYAYSASTANLVVVVPDEAPAGTVVSLVPNGAIARGASKTGSYTSTVAGRLTFQSRGTGDVDLYLKKGVAASRTSYDAKGEGPNANEDVVIDVAVGDKIFYNLYGYAASTASLVVALPSGIYASTLSLTPLSDEAAFRAFSTPGGGLSTSGRSMKFLIDNRSPAARTMNFMNGNYAVGGSVPAYAKYHYDFAKRRYGIGDDTTTFNNSTYFTNTKRFFAGTIQTYRLGAAETLTYAIQFYPDDMISEETLLSALQTVKASFTVPGAKLAFVATGPQQTFARIKPQAAALGIQLLTIDQVLGDIKFVSLNVGEAWGYLRIFPADVSLLRPTDLPVFDELPLDLSVVAGTITKAYQDINSHVNLKAKERNTPNMVLRDAGPTQPVLQAYADKPVHLTVTNEGFSIEPTTEAIIQQKLSAKLSGPWIPLPIVNDTRLLSFDTACPTASSTCFNISGAFGGKTTGLGFLVGALGRTTSPTSASTAYGFDLSPRGVGVPVKFYRDLVNAPQNAVLKTKIAELVGLEKGLQLSPAERNTKVDEVQALFLKAFVPGTLAADLKASLGVVTPGVDKFKFRSSATSEDVPNFNGAGLYDSFAIEPAKTDNPDFSCILETEVDGPVTKLKVKPKTVQCGIKAVYGSLWNSRAIVERTFGRLDHVSAGMGITVNPSYGDELANLVLVTRVTGTDGVYGYTLSVQKGENLVTNPLPGTITEFDVASFSDPGRPARMITTRYAKPTTTDPVLTTTILTDAQMLQIVEIAKRVEIAYCKAKPSYYPGGNCNNVWLDVNKPLSLDMEIKILPDGHIQFKQTREFHGR
jgi:hypothetical protein